MYGVCMKLIRLAAAIIMLPLAAPAYAGFFDSSSDLTEACRATQQANPSLVEAGMVVACIGYMNGFWHGYLMAERSNAKTKEICFVKGNSPHQFAAIFVSWMGRNPKRWHEPVYITVQASLKDALPCR
jgi:GrpB-like predicted nucleotidyltransferase (UPF0157 family)